MAADAVVDNFADGDKGHPDIQPTPSKVPGIKPAFPVSPEDNATPPPAEPVEYADPEPEDKVVTPDDKPEDAEPESQETPGDDQPASQQEGGDDTSAIPDALLKEAKEVYGFSEDDLATYVDAQDLEHALGVIDRRMMDLYGQQVPPAPQQAPQATQTRQPQPQREPTPSAETEQEWKPTRYESKIKAEDLDGELKEEFDRMHEHYHKQMEDMSKVVQTQVKQANEFVNQFAGAMEEQQFAAYEQSMDGFFGSLPEEYQKIYGAGPMRGLDQNGSQAMERREVERLMWGLRDIDHQRGRPVGDMNAYGMRAVRSAHPRTAEKQAKSELRKKANQRRKQAIRRPTANNNRRGSPEQNATEFVKNFYRDRNIDMNPSSQVYQDEI